MKGTRRGAGWTLGAEVPTVRQLLLLPPVCALNRSQMHDHKVAAVAVTLRIVLLIREIRQGFSLKLQEVYLLLVVAPIHPKFAGLQLAAWRPMHRRNNGLSRHKCRRKVALLLARRSQLLHNLTMISMIGHQKPLCLKKI